MRKKKNNVCLKTLLVVESLHVATNVCLNDSKYFIVELTLRYTQLQNNLPVSYGENQ